MFKEDLAFLVLAWSLAAALLLLGIGFMVHGSRSRKNEPCEGISTSIYRFWDVGMVFFLFFLFAGGVLMSVRGGDAGELDADAVGVSIAFLFMITGFVVVIVTLREPLVRWLGLRWSGWRHLIWIGPLGVLLMWAMMGGLYACGYMEWMERLGADSVQDTVKILQDSEDIRLLVLTGVAALFAAPLCEEVVFRGYCYPVLKAFAGKTVSMLVTSMVFACAHGNVLGLMPLFLFGVLLAFIYEKTRTIWAPVVVHFCFNAATVVVQLFARWSESPVFQGL